MDAGLTHEEYQRRGESGEYRPDLERYFLPGMVQPPLPQPKVADPAPEAPEPEAVAEKAPEAPIKSAKEKEHK